MKKTYSVILATILSLVSFQLLNVSFAFAADPPTDLAITTYIQTRNETISVNVCNQGNTDVIAFDVSFSFTNYTLSAMILSTADTTASPTGTINPVSGDWSGGIMGSSQCVSLAMFGDFTGNSSQSIGIVASIESATLADSSINIDTDPTDNTYSETSPAIGAIPDLAFTARLTTSGPITSGSQIIYEGTISSQGAGDYLVSNSGDYPAVYFLMPAGATLDQIVDQNTGDILDTSGCNNLGSVNNFGSQFNAYSGDVLQCAFPVNSGSYIFTGTEFKFDFVMTATSSFVSGVSKVVAVLIGSDKDTARFLLAQNTGGDFFALPINNIARLTFDSTELIPTINACPGQGAVVTVNSACFTISFNKEIHGPSFEASDLVLTGGGSISSFVQNSANLWTVNVTGLQPGKTLTISLVPGGIVDLSAVPNGTQVLGINTVRFETGLPETGNNFDFVTPLIMMLLGYGLLKFSQRKNDLADVTC